MPSTKILADSVLRIRAPGALPDTTLTAPLPSPVLADISAAELAAGYPQAVVDKARAVGVKPVGFMATQQGAAVFRSGKLPRTHAAALLDANRFRFKSAIQGVFNMSTSGITGSYYNRTVEFFIDFPSNLASLLPGALPGPRRAYIHTEHPVRTTLPAANWVDNIPVDDPATVTPGVMSVREFVSAAVTATPTGYVAVSLIMPQWDGNGLTVHDYSDALGKTPYGGSNYYYNQFYQCVVYVPAKYLPCVEMVHIFARATRTGGNTPYRTFAMAYQCHPDMRDFHRRGLGAEFIPADIPDIAGDYSWPECFVYMSLDDGLGPIMAQNGARWASVMQQGYDSLNLYHPPTVWRAPLFGSSAETIDMAPLPLTSLIFKDNFLGVAGDVAAIGQLYGGVAFADSLYVAYNTPGAAPVVADATGTIGTIELPLRKAIVLDYSPSSLAPLAPSSTEAPTLTVEQRAAVNAQGLTVVSYRLPQTSPSSLGTQTAAYASTKGKGQAIAELNASVVLEEPDLDANGEAVVPEHKTPVTYGELALRASNRKYQSLYLVGVPPLVNAVSTVTVAADGSATISGGDLPDGTTLTAEDIIAARMDNATFVLTAYVAAHSGATLASWFLDATGEPLAAYDPEFAPGGGEFSMQSWVSNGVWDVAALPSAGNAGAMMMAFGCPIEGYSGIIRAGFLYGSAAMSRYQITTTAADAATP